MKKRTLLFKLVCLLLIFPCSLGVVACGEGQPDSDASSDIPVSSAVSVDSNLSVSSDVEADMDLSRFEPAVVSEVSAVDWDSSHLVGAHISYVGEDKVWADPDLILFRGTVCSLQNLLIDFGPQYLRGNLIDSGLHYFEIVSVRVNEVYQGDVAPGEEITILVSMIGMLGYFETDRVSYEQMVSGAEGIFGVYRSEDRYANSAERILYYSTVADCVVTLYMTDGGDGVTFRFLYDVLTFPTLDEGGTYVRQKLEQYAD